MNSIKIFLVLLFILLFSFQVSALSTIFYGRVLNNTGSVLSGVNVTVKVNFGSTGLYSNITNSSGHFYMNVSYNTNFDMIDYTTVNYSDSTGNISYTGKTSSRPMPAQMFANDMTSGQDFVVVPAVNIFLQAWNGTTNVSFGYIIKDQKSGNELATGFTGLSQALIGIDRVVNITLMIFQMGGDIMGSGDVKMKVYQYNNLSSYPGLPKYVPLNLTIVPTYVRMSGFITAPNTSIMEYTNITRHIKMLENGQDRVFFSFVFPTRGGLNGDSKATAVNAGLNTSTGFYNVSLVIGMEYVFFILGNDSSTYYGGYFNQTTTGISAEVHRNLSLVQVLGQFNRTAGVVPGNMTRLKIVDGDGRAVNNPFLLVDSNINGTRIFFNLMQVGSNSNEYAFYFLKGAVNKVRVFSSNYQPTVFKLSEANLSNAVFNLTLSSSFSQKGFNGTAMSKPLGIDMYVSNTTCDVPQDPPAGCSLTTFSNASTFSPLKTMSSLTQESISVRIKHPSTNITIHYVGVDMSMSGPPSASFDESTKGEGTAARSTRLGSDGPDTYSAIILGIPYSDTGINENADINIKLPTLYDDDLTTVLWNITVNGSGTQIPSSFNTFNASLLTTDGLVCSKTDLTQTCYVNTTSNIMWLRIPHFSGVDANLAGSAPTTTSTTTTTTTASSSSGSAGASSATANLRVDTKANSAVTYNIGNKEIGVEKIDLVTITKVENAVLKVLEVKELSNDIISPVITGLVSNVYKYFEVKKENLDNSVLGSSKITFSVKIDWLTSNGAKAEDVTLLRYSEAKWNEHSAVKINADGNYYYYESTVPGFSTFAISLKGKIVETPRVEEPLIQNELQNKEVEPLKEEKSNKMGYLWLLVIIIVITIGYLIIKRKQNNNHRPQGKR